MEVRGWRKAFQQTGEKGAAAAPLMPDKQTFKRRGSRQEGGT